MPVRTSSAEVYCRSRGFAITRAVRGFLELLRLIRLSSYSLRPWDTLLIYSRSSAHFGRLIFAECLRLTPSFWSSIGRWACRPNHGLTKTPERLCHSSFLNRQERSADSPSPESNRPSIVPRIALAVHGGRYYSSKKLRMDSLVISAP